VTFREKLEEAFGAIGWDTDKDLFMAGAAAALRLCADDIECIVEGDDLPDNPEEFDRWVFFNQGASIGIAGELHARASEVSGE